MGHKFVKNVGVDANTRKRVKNGKTHHHAAAEAAYKKPCCKIYIEIHDGDKLKFETQRTNDIVGALIKRPRRTMLRTRRKIGGNGNILLHGRSVIAPTL